MLKNTKIKGIKQKDFESQHGIDLEEELVKTLIEEIEKEMKENGSYTWQELCERNKE